MALTVQLLPTSIDDRTGTQYFTTFLLNERVAVDAGSLGVAVSPDRLAGITDVVLTHAHLDHVASLPIAVVEAFPHLQRPIRVYGTAEVLDAVHRHLFNDVIWPDFSAIKLPQGNQNALEWVPIRPLVPFEIEGLKITAVPVNHQVPTVGLIVESDSAACAFTSDTARTDEFWKVAEGCAKLRAVFVDCSFANEFEDLAIESGHLTPALVLQESQKLGRAAEIYCVHIKPLTRDKVLAEICALGQAHIRPIDIGRKYLFE